MIKEDFNNQMKSRIQIRADTLKEISKRKDSVQKELDAIKDQIKELNLKYKEGQSKNSQKFTNPTNTKLFIKISEILILQADIKSKNGRLYYTISDNEDQFNTSKQEECNVIEHQDNQKERRIYVFKEKFQFILKTGLEQLQIKLYSVDQSNHEKEQSAYIYKVSDKLKYLIDQRDHVEQIYLSHITNRMINDNNFELKIVVRWIYDMDIERLSELQQKQYLIEKDLFIIEEHYSKAIKNIQQMQQKAPQITHMKEEWGVFLISPKAIQHQVVNQLSLQNSAHGHKYSISSANQVNITQNSSSSQHSGNKSQNSQSRSLNKINFTKSRTSQASNQKQVNSNYFATHQHHLPEHVIKKVNIDLATQDNNQNQNGNWQFNSPQQKQFLPPTQDNLKKLENKKRNPIGGSIMDSILEDVINKKPSVAKSVALSNMSSFSTMRTGTFFKMVDSPFKFSLMSSFNKNDQKAPQSTINGIGQTTSGGHKLMHQANSFNQGINKRILDQQVLPQQTMRLTSIRDQLANQDQLQIRQQIAAKKIGSVDLSDDL
ncbi:UNKNOWN [Stylonychia lemnae]|uniref:Uncharacterized protein n=1 Tax=Stylonychia lemnae TaxID=5949 RepID=A0A078A920_STYLE|nr:UNKNOWN [Stylonychia lemnae]|eukprot:CDW78714.1 UNKNOWN [Stylonychia lemnae]